MHSMVQIIILMFKIPCVPEKKQNREKRVLPNVLDKLCLLLVACLMMQYLKAAQWVKLHN